MTGAVGLDEVQKLSLDILQERKIRKEYWPIVKKKDIQRYYDILCDVLPGKVELK